MEIRNAADRLIADNADLSGSTFQNVNLSGALFTDADLSNARFEDINLSRTTFHNIDFTGVVLSDCDLTGTTIDGVPIAAALDVFRRANTPTEAGDPSASSDLSDDIRAFQESDEPAVVALWTTVFAYQDRHNDPTASIRRKLEVGRELFLVAVRNSTVVGTVMGGYDGHRGWVYSLAVHPDHRRRGIASELMNHVERLLESRGCVKLNLQLLTSNAATVAFYQKIGYTVEERISMGKRFVK